MCMFIDISYIYTGRTISSAGPSVPNIRFAGAIHFARQYWWITRFSC